MNRYVAGSKFPILHPAPVLRVCSNCCCCVAAPLQESLPPAVPLDPAHHLPQLVADAILPCDVGQRYLHSPYEGSCTGLAL